MKNKILIVVLACLGCNESTPSNPQPPSAAGSGGASGVGGSTAGAGGLQGGNAGFPGLGGAANSCVVEATGACLASTSHACCKVRGERYRWNAVIGCKIEVTATNGTLICAEMSYNAPNDGGDYCTYFALESCLQRQDGDVVDVVVSTATWKPEELGPDWQECSPGVQTQVTSAPLCP